jgi:hypothetical protein
MHAARHLTQALQAAGDAASEVLLDSAAALPSKLVYTGVVFDMVRCQQAAGS